MTSVVSPRNVVLKNLRREVAGEAAVAASADGERGSLPLPALGDMQLHSFYKPSLEAGVYSISVTQDIDITYNEIDKTTKKPITSHQQLPLDLTGKTTATQSFEVVAPQFVIDPKDIHSTYPPQGQADQPSVLPHIVFNDPHLPWERRASNSDNKPKDPDEDSVPWLALFPFDCNGLTPDQQELRLTPEQLNGPSAIYKKDGVEIKQSSMFTIPMTVAEYMSLGTTDAAATPATGDPATALPGAGLATASITKVRIPPFSKDPTFKKEISNLATPVEVIFLSGKLFKQLFPLTSDNVPDVAPFRYLSHVRNVNTAGMVQASAEDAETGLFSIIHSKRTGPTDIAQNDPPRPQIVHLISLEYVDQMVGLETMKDDELVAFISLHRWNYLCQPPLSVNFVDAMRDLGESMKNAKGKDGQDIVRNNLLRCPESVLTSMRIDAAISLKQAGTITKDRLSNLKHAMLERLKDGYTIVRHRNASGEETMAFNRGPLIPTSTAKLPTNWPYGSNFGQDYQIFDSTLGIMDISFSVAWQIGKLLATSDLGFVAALMRIRSMAHRAGKAESQFVAASLSLGLKGKQTVFGSLRASTDMLKDVSNANPTASAATPNLKQRWSHTATVPEATKASNTQAANAAVASAFVTGVRRQVVSTSTVAGKPKVIFDETALAASPDWAYVHTWIMDRLFLSGLPTHYYIGDNSFLPPETIRFFQIDRTWMDCYIDGALSVANHLGRDDDIVREAIKERLNDFFNKKYMTEKSKSLHYPQVPRYGFLLRSAVVTVFPDLTIEVPYPDEETRAGRVPVLLQKHLGKDVLLVLLDRPPEDIVKIKITQPAHQQRFSAGDNLDDTSLDFLFREIYRNPKDDKGTMPLDFFHEFGTLHRLYNPAKEIPAPATGDHVDASEDITKEPFYDWNTQCLDLRVLERFLLGEHGVYSNGSDPSMAQEWGPLEDGSYRSMSSAMTALTLNDTMKYLEIKGLNYEGKIKTPQEPYWIRTKDPPPQLKLSNKRIANMEARTADKRSLLASVSTTPLPSVSVNAAVQPLLTSTRAEALAHTTTPSHLIRLAPLLGEKPVNLRAAAFAGPAIGAGPAGGAGGKAAAKPTAGGGGVGAAGPATPQAAVSNVMARDRSFKYAIYPSTSKFVPPLPNQPSSNSYVFVDTPYIPDLIFSININPIATNPVEVVENGQKVKKSLWLREVQFKIPIGNPDLRKGDADIQGLGLVPPGASAGLRGRMLDNQRWVVHMDPASEYMVVRVIARSTKQSTPVEWNRNLSFKLMEVDVAGIDVGVTKPATGQVEIRVSEVYAFRLPDGKWQDQGRANWTWKLPRRIGFATGWRPQVPT